MLYTEARDLELRGEVRLPGTLESQLTAVVAGEVAGKVVAIEAQDGDRVKKGQVLARLRPQWYELQQREAVARLEESRARLRLAESKLARARELFEAEVISQQDMDDAVSEQTAWQGRESQNEAQIAQLELSLALLRVRAPFDGVVTRKLTEVGQWIVNGGAVAEMISLDRLEVRVDVPERYYDTLRRGTQTRISFEALPDFSLTGTIERIVPRVGDQARTFPVKISISNPDGRLGVGMLASVDLPIGETKTATMVPKDAVVRIGPDDVVYRISNGTAERVDVRSGTASGAWIAVSGGIRAGDKVIVRGNERMMPGQSVQGKPQEYADP